MFQVIELLCQGKSNIAVCIWMTCVSGDRAFMSGEKAPNKAVFYMDDLCFR